MSTLHPNSTHLGERYELKSQAGTGGMGTVFQAYDRANREVVAVKVLHGKGDTDAARFEREAELLAELRHPAIVRFIDYGTTSHGEPFYVMEWLEGETLDERLARGSMMPSLVARLAARVMQALTVAHSKGVIHRDIKPTNIFLASHRVTEAKLIDFGVARKTDDAFRLTKRGNTVGTPMYNAPEQARGKGDLDGRVDVFALGCVMYEALTGEAAFVGDSPGQVMSRIAGGQGPDLNKRLATLDPELRGVLASMLAHNRDNRPADGLALSTTLSVIADRLEPAEVPLVPSQTTMVPPKRTSRDALSYNEQRVMTVLVLARLAITDSDVAARPIMRASMLTDEVVTALATLLEPFGGRVDRLLDRSVIVTAPALPSVTEQAEQIGRMGLTVVARYPDLSVAMATGRAALLARLPAGEVIEQAAALLEGGAMGAVVTDDISARLLSGRFSVLHERSQHVLLNERDGGLAPRRILGEVTPFSGRERELASLTGLLAECVADDVSRAAVVVAGAGVGKSRLLAEWVRRMKATAEDVLVMRSRAIPLNLPQPFAALSGLFAQANITPDLDPAMQSEVLSDWLKAACKKQPVIAILEDAHVADTSSLQLLDSLLARLETLPFLVVLTARPELDERLPDLFESRSPMRMRLPPLPKRHAEAALRGLLPISRPDLDEWILVRARGNAFCLEELARHALLPGRATLPETVLGLVHAELEVLGSEGKRLLRAASVFGMSFTTAGVAALLGEAAGALLEELLLGLVERGYLEYTPNSAEGQWRFVEPVVREVAYDTLSGSDRILGRRMARAFLKEAGQAIPTVLAPGESKTEMTPSQLPALSFLARR